MYNHWFACNVGLIEMIYPGGVASVTPIFTPDWANKTSCVSAVLGRGFLAFGIENTVVCDNLQDILEGLMIPSDERGI